MRPLSSSLRILILMSPLLLFISTSVFAQTFAKKQTLFTGPSPYGIKTVDVNNDGNLDLIWLSSEHNLEVRLGHGDGTFATSGPIYDTKLRSSAEFLRDAEEFEVADLNHDKKPDIVVAGGHNISLLRGNGDGTFQSPALYNLVSSDPAEAVDSLALADFNKDGQVDAVVSIGGTIQVAFGNGSGSFLSPPKVFAMDDDQSPTNVEAGDLDGDGNTDIAFTTCCIFDEDHTFPNSLLVWYGDGKGNLPVKQTVGSGLFNMRIKVFDINRDGKYDIVDKWMACMDSCTHGVETWLGHSSRTYTHYSSGLSENQTGYRIKTGVTWGDFDLDGVLDLATGAGDIVPDGFLMFQRSTNNAIAPFAFRSVQSSELLSDSEIISGDFNHDNKADLAITYDPNNEVIVMTNTTTVSGPCAAGALYSMHLCTPVSGSYSSPVQVTARANSDRTITGWKLYVDGISKASGIGANVNVSLTLAPSSQRHLTVKAWDASGRELSSSVVINVR